MKPKGWKLDPRWVVLDINMKAHKAHMIAQNKMAKQLIESARKEFEEQIALEVLSSLRPSETQH